MVIGGNRVETDWWDDIDSEHAVFSRPIEKVRLVTGLNYNHASLCRHIRTPTPTKQHHSPLFGSVDPSFFSEPTNESARVTLTVLCGF